MKIDREDQVIGAAETETTTLEMRDVGNRISVDVMMFHRLVDDTRSCICSHTAYPGFRSSTDSVLP